MSDANLADRLPTSKIKTEPVQKAQPSHRWYERHRWEAVDCYQGAGKSSIATGSERIIITVVLYRCECGKHKTRTFNGHWSLEKLRGEPQKPPRPGHPK